MQLRSAWDRNHPRLLGKQPSERDLGRCRLLPFCDAAEQVNQGLIRLESLRREARQGAAEVGAVEGRVNLKAGMAGIETAQATQHQTNPIAPRWTFRVRTH
jgi:hypothetical protein